MTTAGPSDDNWKPLTREGLAATLRAVYRERSRGVLEIEGIPGQAPLYFERGALFIGGTPPAPSESALSADGGVLSIVDPTQLRTLQALVDTLRFDGTARFAFFQGPVDVPVDAYGPVPAFALGVQLATRGVRDDELLARLGGASARFVLDHRAAADGLPPLRPPVQRLISRLAEPHSLGELERIVGRACVRPVAALHAMGFVIPEPEEDVSEDDEPGRVGRVPEAFLEQFRGRIRKDLERRPLELEPEEHREVVARLVGTAGAASHYELLELPYSASAEQVAKSFENLARLVHPLHVATLDLGRGEGVLETLFERATEAYLVLSDPQRKARYDHAVNVRPGMEDLSEEKMAEVRKSMARESYELAREAAHAEDYHAAFENVRDALRYDDQPEYHALLGLVQSNNPQWQRDAIGSFQQAIEGRPEELAYRLRLAELLENMGRYEQALAEYQVVLEHSPYHHDAGAAVTRLTIEHAKDKKGPVGWYNRWRFKGE